MTIRVVTLGCKVNQCESSSIVSALISENYSASVGLASADVYILNTCSVTAEADKKSRQYLAKMRALNPDCAIIVVGCSSQNSPDKFTSTNVIAVGGTSHKCEFVLNTLKNVFKNNQYSILSDRVLYQNVADIDSERVYCYEKHPVSDKTRAFIKVQNGCNRFCTYCIIPYLRGRNRSRSIDDILCECKGIRSKEIVITGIDISEYGTDIGEDLVSLLKALSAVKGRKRLGSLECEAVDERLLEIMQTGNYCPHFHLSLQSGSDVVLKTMNRKYTSEYYYKKVELIRKYFPLAGITTDIIVGFPTETDELFDEGYEFVKRCEFSDIHVFPYSQRDGTLAAKKYKTLPHDIVKSRVDRLLALKKELHRSFLEKNLDVTEPVYVEDTEGEYNVGYTPNYIKVYSKAPCGDIVDLKLSELYGDIGMIGI